MAKSIGELSVVIGADPSGFKRGLAEMKSGISDVNKEIGKAERDWKKSFGNIEKYAQRAGIAFTAMGTVIVGGLYKLTTEYASNAEELLNLSDKTGIGVKSISEIKYVVEQTGGSMESFATAIKSMYNKMDEGGKTFEKWGINIGDIKKLAPEEQFWAIADSIASIEDPAKRSAAAVDIFGKAGTDLLPVLAQGKDAIKKMREEAEKFGITMTQEQAEAAAKFDDQVGAMTNSLKGLGYTIAQAVMPAFNDLVTKVTDIVTKISDWAKNNQWAAEMLLKIGGALIGAGGVLLSIAALAKIILTIKEAFIIIKGLNMASIITGVGTSAQGASVGVGALGIALGKVAIIAAGVYGWITAIKNIVDNWDLWKQSPYETFKNMTSKPTVTDKQSENLKKLTDTQWEQMRKQGALSDEQIDLYKKYGVLTDGQSAALKSIKADSSEVSKRLIDNSDTSTEAIISNSDMSTDAILSQLEEMGVLTDAQLESLKAINASISGEENSTTSSKTTKTTAKGPGGIDLSTYPTKTVKVGGADTQVVDVEQMMRDADATSARLTAASKEIDDYLKSHSYGDGALISSPTVARIADKGPEAVIPWDDIKGGFGGNTNVYVTVQGSVQSEQNLIDAIKKGLAAKGRLNFFGPSLSGYGSGTSGL